MTKPKKHIAALTVTTVLIVLIAIFYWLLATASGLQTIVNISHKAVPGLIIGDASGRLYDGLKLTDIHYQPETGPDVQVGQVEGRWHLWSLFAGRLIIDQLHIDSVQVKLPATVDEPPDPDKELFELHLPVGLHIRSLRILDVEYQTAEQETPTLLFTRLDAAVRLGYNRLTISSLNVTRPDTALTMVGDVQLSGDYVANLNYGLNINHPEWGLLSATATLSGDAERMTLRQQVGEPFASEQIIIVENALDDLSWKLLMDGEAWSLSQLIEGQQGFMRQFSVIADGDLSSASIALETDITALHEQLPPLHLKTRLNSDDLSRWIIDSQLALEKAGNVDVSGSVDITEITNPKFALTGRWQSLQWPMQSAESMVSDINGQISLSGSLKNYQILLNSKLAAYDTNLRLQANAEGNDSELNLGRMALQNKDGELLIDGRLQWQDNLAYQLDARWRDFQIPEQVTTGLDLQLENGQLRFSGDSKQFRAQTDGILAIDGQKYRIGAMADSPAMQGADVTLDVQLDDGKAGFAGHIDWFETLAAKGKLTLTQFNPGRFLAEWPGAIDGQAEIDFQQPDNSPREIYVNDLALTGELRDRPFALNANIEMINQQLNIAELVLKSGASRLNLNGKLLPEADASWQIDSPQLSDFMPDLSGSLQASGTAVGVFENLQINARARGESVQYADLLSLATLRADADINLAEQQRGSLQLELQDMTVAGQQISGLSLDFDGNQQQHNLALQVDSEMADLHVTVQGALDKSNQWQGNFQKFSVESAESGQWHLAETGSLQISTKQQQLSRHCWQSSGSAEVCLNGQNSASDGWQIASELQALPITLFKLIYQDMASLSGIIDGRLQMATDADNNLIGEGVLDWHQASLQMTGEGIQQPQPVKFDTFNFQYQADAEQTVAGLNIVPDLAGVSPLEARLQTVPLKALIADPANSELAMQLQTAVEDLAALQFSHPSLEDLQGAFQADIDVNGTFRKPAIDAMLSVRDAQAGIVDLGILLTDLNADITGDPLSGINLLVQGKSGEGVFEIDGELLMPDAGWQLTANIRGDDMLLMQLPEAYVRASPDLNIALDADTAEVTGQVTIPEAELAPMQFNMAVSPSQDVVIVNEPAAESKLMQTDIDVLIRLGDAVSIRAAGFQGKLKGDLAISGDAGELLLGDGEIILYDGNYQAYGRSLTVDNGRILFSGGAIDNPDLDVKAVREGDDYTAGIHITGPVANPQASLFSTPTMAQDDVLSYILIGRPIDQAGAGDGALLASAATGLGIQNGNALSDQIADTFGLDKVSFSGESPETAAVQIGKYLSPKLYVGYGVGVLEPVSTVQLRYKLSKIWTLQAESGTESGVDLLYIFER